MPGNRRPKPKMKCRKTREVKAAVPHHQPIVQNLTPRKTADVATLSDDTEREVKGQEKVSLSNQYSYDDLISYCYT